jgi:long-subunit fatty acid transport protein
MSSYQFGILYRPVKWLNLGFNYAYKAPAYTVIPIYLPPSLLPETSLLMEINSSGPTSITFGVGLFPTENLTIAFDISYDMWSPTNQWTRITSSDPDFLSSDYPDVTLRDVWAHNVGFEYTDKLRGKLSNTEYSVRAGYGFYPSPYPRMPEGTSNIDNDAHKFSGGFALGFYPKKKFDYIGLEYFWEYVELVERSHVDISRNPAVIVSDGYVIYTGVSFNIKI